MFSAWQTARLTNYSGKKLKSLRDCLKELRPQSQKQRQTSAEKIQALRAIMATMGGPTAERPRPD